MVTKIFSNKRGQSADEAGYNLPYFIILGIGLVILFAGQVGLYASIKNQKLEVDDEVFQLSYIHRFLNSPDCFTYQGNVGGRIYEGVIDLSKFTKSNLHKCYDILNTSATMNFQLRLRDLATGENRIIQTENYYVPFDSVTRLVQIRKPGGDQVLGELDIFIDT